MMPRVGGFSTDGEGAVATQLYTLMNPGPLPPNRENCAASSSRTAASSAAGRKFSTVSRHSSALLTNSSRHLQNSFISRSLNGRHSEKVAL